MLSTCDNYECKNGMIIERLDESDTIIDQYPCEECEISEFLDTNYNSYTIYYDEQGNIYYIETGRRYHVTN